MTKELVEIIDKLDKKKQMLKDMSTEMDSKVVSFLEKFNEVYDCAKEMSELFCESRKVESDSTLSSVTDLFENDTITKEELEEYYNHYSEFGYEYAYTKETAYLLHDIVVNINDIVDRLNSIPEFSGKYKVI